MVLALKNFNNNVSIEVLLLKTLWKFIYKILQNAFNSFGILLQKRERHERQLFGNEMKHSFLCWKISYK